MLYVLIKTVYAPPFHNKVSDVKSYGETPTLGTLRLSCSRQKFTRAHKYYV